MTTKRPMSAPKPNDVTAAIPRIVLDDRGSGGGGGGGGGDPTSTRPATLTHRPPAPNGPGVTTTTVAMTTTSTTMTMTSVAEPKESPDGAEYIPHRCNSDIGLPTSSMPNLTLALTLGEDGAGGRGKLGVYCSPRTTRRSVDLDVTSRDPAARAEYDWLEDKTSSLHVLSASSRVGSALSLNSVCTAHSVGLLSNDSDDDFQDTSINESSPRGEEQEAAAGGAQLRRLQSYPEEDHAGPNDSGVTPRTSHSLCNLQAAQVGPTALTAAAADSPARAHAPEPELTAEKLSLLPSDLDECPPDRGGVPPPLPPPGPRDRRERREGGKGGARQKVGPRGEGEVRKAPMVSYGTGSASMREGRIRRWLEDMDKAS
ncbi:uncharacterized protein LOC143301367 isoform X2 [Babylonia areolata]|uniref:uncharacterized protein LOC143301367 isoform X2 n=1 Tax=Babylonia areolata TaxID=304850 RepID=UPI003FCFDEEB